MVDEDYIGTFSIVKKMSHEFNYKMKAEPEDLPCCFDGWSSMNYRDQKAWQVNQASSTVPASFHLSR
jgi:hypothetical protein